MVFGRFTMIDDETHPEMLAAQRQLTARLAFITAGRAPSRLLYEDVIRCRDDHRTRWRLRGVDFPTMVIFAVPRLMIMELWRADLDPTSIRVKMLNVTMAFPTVTPRELSVALRAAYPDGPISMLVDEGEAMTKRIAERDVARS